jgi:hypothetical protein
MYIESFGALGVRSDEKKEKKTPTICFFNILLIVHRVMVLGK